ncbi:MAG: hypothetical protein ACRD0H_15990, partial [Actinomycetes bacterium]
MSATMSTHSELREVGLAEVPDIDDEHRALATVRATGQVLVRTLQGEDPRVLVVVDDMPFLIEAMLL